MGSAVFCIDNKVSSQMKGYSMENELGVVKTRVRWNAGY